MHEAAHSAMRAAADISSSGQEMVVDVCRVQGLLIKEGLLSVRNLSHGENEMTEIQKDTKDTGGITGSDAGPIVERLYYHVLRIRRVEETIAEIYRTDAIKSPVHLSIGQEAISVGVCLALGPEDVIFPSYRCHAAYLAKGGDLKSMLCELFGKSNGCCGGWGGSMHLADPAHGVMGASAVVASTIPLAVGWAYAQKLRGRPDVAVAFFGDGAIEEGVFHESLNFAKLHRLPVLFVLEDNGWAVHLPLTDRQRDPVAETVGRFGIPSVTLSLKAAADPLRVYENAAYWRRRLENIGPCLLYAKVERWRAHVGPEEDWAWGYRDKPAELPDCVAIAGMRVESARRADLEGAVEAEMKEAVQFAEDSPWPSS